MRRINTIMPAEITKYDAGTRLAQVQPLLRLVTTDGEEMDRPLIEDVLVLDLGSTSAVGDKVLLLVTQDDVTEFKTTMEMTTPEEQPPFQWTNAMALPGISPNAAGGALNSGDSAFMVTDDMVMMSQGDSTITLTEDQLLLERDEEMVSITPGEINMVRGMGGATPQSVALTDAGITLEVTGDLVLNSTGTITANRTIQTP